MDQLNDTPSPDELEAGGPAGPRRGESRLKEFLLVAGAVLTAVVAVGGGIFVLSRDTGPLHAANASASGDATAGTPAAGQGSAVAPSSATRAESPRASAATIFRCEVNGKTVYANVPCSSRNIHPVDVFVNKGFQPTGTSASVARKMAPAAAAPVASSGESSTAERCNSIEEAIRQNEQTARRPQSGQTQDDLAQQRRKLLDEKHELGC